MRAKKNYEKINKKMNSDPQSDGINGTRDHVFYANFVFSALNKCVVI